MVINDPDVLGSKCLSGPLKTNPPLTIDADTELAFAIPCQRLESIAGQRDEILQPGGRLQAVQLQARSPCNS